MWKCSSGKWLLALWLAESYIESSEKVHGENLNAHLLRFVARTLSVAGIITIIFVLTRRLRAPCSV